MRTTATVEVQRPAAEVFAWLNQAEQAGAWLDGVSDVTPLQAESWQKGAKFTYRQSRGKRTDTYTGIITAWEPGQRLGVKVLDGPGRLEGLVELAEQPGGATQVTVTIAYGTGNVVAGMIYAFAPGRTDRKYADGLAAALERFRRAVE